MNAAWRDASTLARITRGMLYAQAALAAVSSLLALTRDAMPVGKLSIQLLGIAESLAFLGCAAAVLIWIYRAHANARAIGATDMMVSPGWAVGWFFIPLANLAMPFVAMRELWKASTNPKDWQLIRAPIMLPVWWGFWIASNVAGLIAFRLGWEPDPDARLVGQTFYLASDLLSIGAALALASIVGGVQALQARVRTEGLFG